MKKITPSTNRHHSLLGLVIALVLVVVLGAGGLWWANHKTSANHGERLITTTYSMTMLFHKLGIPLVGVPTTAYKLPAEYKHLPQVGNHMGIKFDKIYSLKPTTVFVDSALTDDYRAKLKEAKIKMQPLDFTNLETFKAAVKKLGKTYHVQNKANALLSQLNLKTVHRAKKPRVLILMGMPGGSFLVMNKTSYIGDLVTRAGGQVVAASSTSLYGIASSEQIAKANPQIVIRLAHAMPTQVIASFKQTFKQAPYKSLDATTHHRVYDVTLPKFSPTCNIYAKQAYAQINKWLDEVSK